MPWWLIVCAVPFLSACVSASRCQPEAGEPMRIYDLYFGRSVSGGGEVSEAEWRAFRDHVITPALPNGYTVRDGMGAWRNPGSLTTITEASKILTVALPDDPGTLSVVNRIRRAWRERFHQYVVGMTMVTGCGTFSPTEASP